MVYGVAVVWAQLLDLGWRFGFVVAADAPICSAGVGYLNGRPLRKVESGLRAGVEMRPRESSVWNVNVADMGVEADMRSESTT